MKNDLRQFYYVGNNRRISTYGGVEHLLFDSYNYNVKLKNNYLREMEEKLKVGEII